MGVTERKAHAFFFLAVLCNLLKKIFILKKIKKIVRGHSVGAVNHVAYLHWG